MSARFCPIVVHAFNREPALLAPVLNLRQKGFPVTRMLGRILREDDGQDLIEYAFVAALISVISVLALESVGVAINDRYETSTTTFTGS